MSLLEKWNAGDEIDSDSSSASDESDTSKSEADTAAVGDRFHGVHSPTLTSSSTILTARRFFDGTVTPFRACKKKKFVVLPMYVSFCLENIVNV